MFVVLLGKKCFEIVCRLFLQKTDESKKTANPIGIEYELASVLKYFYRRRSELSKFSRMYSLLLVLMLVVTSFAGCSSGGNQTEAVEETVSQSGNVEQEEKIVLETFPDLFPEAMMKSLEAAGLADKVEIREVPQNQYENKIRMMIAGGEVGDLICIDAPNIAYYANMEAIVPLNDYWNQEDFNDLVGSAQTAMQWNGKKWAAPLNESNTVLYYNKEMFEEAGLKPAKTLDEAWDFETLMEAARKLTKKDENGNIVRYGILPQMFTPNNRNEGMTYTQMLWTWWAGAEVLSPDGKMADGYFNSEENKRALQFYYDLHNTYKASPTEDMQNGFAGEKIAMWINGPWMQSIWQNNFPEFSDKWGVMPLPHDKASASPSGSWNIAITSNSKNKELAYEVLQALTGKEGARIYCTETKNIPARKSILESESMFSEGPLWEVINAQMLSNSKARPVTPVYPQISEALMDCYNAVAYGQDVDSAIEEAVEKMEQALK